MAVECHLRDPTHQKPLICVMDGEPQLWKLAEEWFPRAIGILDLFHVLERLWAVAHCFHAKESPEAGAFVTHHLRMLLQGKVRYVLRNFRKLVKTQDLKGVQKKTVMSAITYYENNREHMRYDEYLAAGYPIASGVAEGTCKHLVKDRMGTRRDALGVGRSPSDALPPGRLPQRPVGSLHRLPHRHGAGASIWQNVQHTTAA